MTDLDLDPTAAGRGCLAFLRELDAHVAGRVGLGRRPAPAAADAAADGRRDAAPTAAHVRTCARCAGLLERAVERAAALRARPSIPAEARSREFLDRVFERVVDAVEAAPIGRAVAATLQTTPAPAACPWPLQTAAVAGLGQPPTDSVDRFGPAAAAELWRRTRAEVLEVIASNQVASSSPVRAAARVGGAVHTVVGALRRGSVAAAALLLIALCGWNLAQSDGTPAQPEIVFVHVDELPASVASHVPIAR